MRQCAQFIGGIETISYLPIPKWLVSGLIPYGLASAALYFLRQLMGDVVAADAKGPDV